MRYGTLRRFLYFIVMFLKKVKALCICGELLLWEKNMPKKKTYALEDSFAELDEVIALARDANQLTSMLKAIELKGKLAGLYTESKKPENEPDIAQILVKFVDNLEERYEKNKRQNQDQMCRDVPGLCSADDRKKED